MKNFEKCPVCDEMVLKPVYQLKWKRSGFHKCRKCSLIFQNPQEGFEDTAKRYNSDYFDYEFTNETNFFELVKKTITDFDVLSILEKGASVLEIGCATGLFLKFMEDCGYNAAGVEICKESAEYGIKKYGVNIINKTLYEAGFKEKSFDFIHFSHLIEHLNDPKDFISLVYRLLKPAGFIIVTTPNSSGLFSGFYNENWRCIVDDHLFLFNKSNLSLLLKNNGFIIDDVLTWGSIPGGKSPKFIKSFTDKAVKLTGTGDVVSILAYKNNFHEQ